MYMEREIDIERDHMYKMSICLMKFTIMLKIVRKEYSMNGGEGSAN